MWLKKLFSKPAPSPPSDVSTPDAAAIAEAKRNPNGWVYVMDGIADRNGAVPALPLTEPLRERLRQIREHQMAEHRAGHPQLVCEVFYDEEVVCLRAGGGHAAYLGTDGRVHYENYGEGFDKVVLTDPRDFASAIVKCAGDIGMPELIDLLPPRPTNGFVCRVCKGTRWESPESTNDPDGRPWCCRRCNGLGWTLAEPSAAADHGGI